MQDSSNVLYWSCFSFGLAEPCGHAARPRPRQFCLSLREKYFYIII